MTTKPIHNIADTWNDIDTTFNAMKMNVTDRASADASKLFLLQVDGTDVFTVDKSGAFQDSLFAIANNANRTKKVQFQVSGVTTGTTRTLTVPDFDGTIATLAGTEAFTNKTIDSANNTLTLDLSEGTLTGTLAEFNIALSDGSFASLDGSEVLTNKTIDSANNTLTLDLSEGTLTGTLAEFNTALSDENFVSIGGAEILTNKTLTSPVLNGALSGDAFLDEDTMASNSATKLASQQSIKAYVDAQKADMGVADYTALKALTAGVVSSVFVEDADRGGIFVWSSADNSTNVTNDPGEAIYVPPDSDNTGASGAWVRHAPDHMVRVTWAGADRTGVANASVAIQRAWDIAYDLGWNAVAFPAGDYLFSGATGLDIAPSSGTEESIRLVAEGGRATLHRETSQNDNLIWVDGSAGATINDVLIEGIGFAYDPASDQGSVGQSYAPLLITNCNRVRVQNNEFTGFSYYDLIVEDCDTVRVNGNTMNGFVNRGVYLIGANNDVVVDGNLLDGTTAASNGAYGINTNDENGAISADRIVVTNNIIKNVSAHGISASGSYDYVLIDANNVQGTTAAIGILVQESTAADQDSCVVSNNITVGCSIGVEVATDSQYVTVTGNQIYDTNSDGIYINDGCDYITVSNNTVKNAGGEGIYVEDASLYVSILNNMIEGPAANGIEFEAGTTNITIVGNTVEGAGAIGIKTDGSTDVSTQLNLSSNTVLNSTDIGIQLRGVDDFMMCGNYVYNSGAASSGMNVYIIDCEDGVISGCVFDSNEDPDAHNLYLQAASSPCRNIVFNGCMFKGAGTSKQDVVIQGADGTNKVDSITFNACQFIEGATYSFNIIASASGAVNKVHLIGCLIQDATNAFITPANATNMVMEGGRIDIGGTVESGAGSFTYRGVAGNLETDISALTDNSGGSADNTIAAVSGSGDDTNINNNFADLAEQVNALRTALRNQNLMA